MAEHFLDNMVRHFKSVEELKLHIIILAAVFCFLFALSFLKGKTKFCKLNVIYAVAGILLSFSASAIFVLTLLGREYQPSGIRFEWELFWSYKRAFAGGSMDMAVEIFLNILLFVPFGILLPVIYKRFERFQWLLLTSLCVSVGIEVVQGIFALGLCEFDDMFDNTLGAVIGWGTWRMLFKYD